VRFAFGSQLLAGIACTAAMYLAAAPLANFFGDPRLEPVVQWMSAALLLGALSGVSTCLLQRDLNFRALGLIQLAAYAAGYLAVGVPMALLGYGPLALAAACVVQTAVGLVAGYTVRPHPLIPRLRHKTSRETLETGRTVFVTNLVNWMLANVDRAVIGRVLNAHSVGLYSVAYNIASIPYVLLVNAAQPAFLATGARLQDRPQELAQAWKAVLACVLVFLVPAAVVMALLAGDLVMVLYGPAWAEAGWLMAVMFLCLPAWACLGMSTPVLWNTGRRNQESWLQLPVLAAALPAWWFLAPLGVRAVALASAAVIVLRAAVVIVAGMRAVQLPARDVLPLFARGALLGALFALVVETGRLAAQAAFHAPAWTLVSGASLALFVAIALVSIRPQLLGSEARAILSRFIPSVGPSWSPPVPEPRT